MSVEEVVAAGELEGAPEAEAAGAPAVETEAPEVAAVPTEAEVEAEAAAEAGVEAEVEAEAEAAAPEAVEIAAVPTEAAVGAEAPGDTLGGAVEAAERGATIRARLKKSDVIKFAGLLAFFALCGIVVWLLWPYIGLLFQDGGIEILRDSVKSAGAGGVFILLGIQLLQIIVAFIPGEVVQIAAGMIYGTWGGFGILLVGCIFSQIFVFYLVRKLGAPFVQEMVSTKYLEKFQAFERSGKLDIIVFVLFLCPGMPKDVFTYLVPLTNMPLGRFMMLTILGRIPALFCTTLAANGLMQGNYVLAIIVFGIAAVLAVLGVVFREKILAFFGERFAFRKKD